MQYRPKLDEMERRFDELTGADGRPAVISDSAQYRKITKAQSDLSDIVGKYRQWKSAHQNLEEARVMLTDADQDLRDMSRDEVTRLEPELVQIEQDNKNRLLPKDPNDDKNIVLEIRAGTGGDEATLFANEVFRMYSRFAETRGWKVEVTSASDSAVGGLKEVIALVSGDKVFSQLKYESGVHRVQRVPATEQQGRVHTSAITVAVMPEADEVEIKLEAKDVRIDTFCSSGPGGQSVNTTYSAVRLTHLPTGTVVSCQDEKSQIKNRAKAERVLRSRLYEMELQKQQDKLGAERRSMVGTGDRSEKIRTYNFPQNRLTDHRIGLTLHQLNLVMEGKLEPIIDALAVYYQNEGLKDSSEPQGGPPIIPREDLQTALLQGQQLLDDARIEVPRLTAEVLLAHAIGCERSWLYAHSDEELREVWWIHYGRYLHERIKGKPTQYITGRQEFYGREFRVTPDVLIPRPETEHSIETALAIKATRILDIGTGSGAIGVTLSLETSAQVVCTDISEAAVRVAAENARRLGSSAQFLVCDLGSALAGASFDLVISNPPYVPTAGLETVQREVRDHEPHRNFRRIQRPGRPSPPGSRCRAPAETRRLSGDGNRLVGEPSRRRYSGRVGGNMDDSRDQAGPGGDSPRGHRPAPLSYAPKAPDLLPSRHGRILRFRGGAVRSLA